MENSPVVYSIFPVRSGRFSGLILAVERRGKILALRFLPPRRAGLRERIKREYHPAREGKTSLLKAVERDVRKYFRGACRKRFQFPLDFSGYTDFQRRILGETRKIPCGKSVTYRRLAEAAGRPGSARAAGRALGANRHLLLVPCHRVIRADGSPGGFSAPGGTALKARLLRLEKN